MYENPEGGISDCLYSICKTDTLSKSRGLEDSREKVKRFDSEVALFEARWGKELEKGDPNYNPNFRLDEKDFRLNVHVRR